MLLILPDIPLRSAPFALEDRWLLWSRVRVYADRLELVGWSLAGRHRRQIPLPQIEETDHEGERLLLELEDGERVTILVDEPARWARSVRVHRDVYRSSTNE